MRAALPATLIGLSLLLAGGIVYESVAPLDPVTIELPPPRHFTPPPPPRVYVPPPEDAFADIDARPVFAADRKPLADDMQGASAATAASTLSLVGVIMDGERAIALLRNKTTSQTESAVVGGTIEGWHVAHIDATSITLSAGGNQAVVQLEGPGDQPPSAALPQPVQQAAPPPAAPVGQPQPLTPPPTQQASAPPAAATVKPAEPQRKPTIAPEALKGAPRDPTTGEPTL
jgi:general secretion pathway protein N